MTDEDKKLILEWCGFKILGMGSLGRLLYYYPKSSGVHSDYAPDLDINFYFKYTVPKLEEYGIKQNIGSAEHCAWVRRDGNLYGDEAPDPAEAFGQALLKLIKEALNEQN